VMAKELRVRLWERLVARLGFRLDERLKEVE
jgi:hypothetical protein